MPKEQQRPAKQVFYLHHDDGVTRITYFCGRDMTREKARKLIAACELCPVRCVKDHP